VNITIMSYRGVLYWGIMACPETIPKVWHLAAAIPPALDELLDVAGLEPATYRSEEAADAVRAAGIDVADVAPAATKPVASKASKASKASEPATNPDPP
jgi:hypothetical protein